jgi:protoporphyrin/coproporphyrin ferrochelatase
MNYDHILIVGFGGPRKSSEIMPFLKQVTRGRNIPEARLQDVVHHYEAIGGSSPYNECVSRFEAKLRTALQKLEIAGSQRSAALPVFSGMRNWHPFLKDTLTEIKNRALSRALILVLAVHRSEASYDRYVESLKTAQKEAGFAPYVFEALGPWHDDDSFIGAQAESVQNVIAEVSPGQKMHILFTAHSIPVSMAAQCPYAETFQVSSKMVMYKVGNIPWSLAYQSRSGNPRDPWLSPDAIQAVGALKEKGVQEMVVVPIGFLCDNAEILFDLDIELREEIEKLGLAYHRAKTVLETERVADMFARLIREKINAEAGITK